VYGDARATKHKIQQHSHITTRCNEGVQAGFVNGLKTNNPSEPQHKIDTKIIDGPLASK
jgi:hypothetical protein